jgi:hypothetical protein
MTLDTAVVGWHSCASCQQHPFGSVVTVTLSVWPFPRHRLRIPLCSSVN